MASDTPHIRVAARAIIVRDGMLLVQYYEDGPDRWCTTPGGGIDKGERLDVGLAREVFEELGIGVTIGKLRYVRELRGATKVRLLGGLSPDFHQIEHFFEVTAFGGEPGKGAHTDNYAAEFAWIPLAELERHEFFPGPLRERLARDVAAGWPEGAVYLGDA
jgi:8-oxo-dGTP diphosphatase